jgi:hypothetical protein
VRTGVVEQPLLGLTGIPEDSHPDPGAIHEKGEEAA